MTNPNPFDCACKHPVSRHREKVWPRFIAGCSDCDCDTYTPNYKAGK
jgi:hypothetical protein